MEPRNSFPLRIRVNRGKQVIATAIGGDPRQQDLFLSSRGGVLIEVSTK